MTETTLCECGCGQLARRRFLPGHDSKLRSRLLNELRDGNSNLRRKAEAELRRRGWLQHSVQLRAS